MQRLFAFGCSFTNYKYWTWANILSQQYDWFENWGQAGAGNAFIFHSVMEADQRHRFQDGDTVIVCWTDIMREDRYIEKRGWITLGNVAWADNVYRKEFIDSGVCEHGNLLRDLNMIKAVYELLQSRPGVTWRFLCMVPIDRLSDMDTRRVERGDMLDLYSDVLSHFPKSFIDVLGENYWHKNTSARLSEDYHPTTQEHLQYLDAVLPGWMTNQALRDTIEQNPILFQKGLNGSCTAKRFQGQGKQ